MELVRLAFPRRMYTQSPLDYAAEVIADLKHHARTIRGVRILRQPPFCGTSPASASGCGSRSDQRLQRHRFDRRTDAVGPHLCGGLPGFGRQHLGHHGAADAALAGPHAATG